ncbi:MAG: class I SAM-dependent methyltransferase [Alphaproteobacteria bacterium]|nr:class I SAM-dependent methyltransferase [Alphaproteobacteria bacterium]
MLPTERAAADEFDRWAAAGRGESMADGHRDVTTQGLSGWSLTRRDRVLDVGCGNGWAVRWLRHGAPAGGPGAGFAMGVDVSPAMVRRARQLRGGDMAQRFEVASGAALPLADDAVSHVLSVESLYYYPDPGAALAEWRRVTRDGGRFALVIELYAENQGSLAWVDALDVAVHVLGADAWADLARAAGWQDVRWRQVQDRRPLKPREAFVPSAYSPSYDHYLAYRRAGALVVEGVAR